MKVAGPKLVGRFLAQPYRKQRSNLTTGGTVRGAWEPGGALESCKHLPAGRRDALWAAKMSTGELELDIPFRKHGDDTCS